MRKGIYIIVIIAYAIIKNITTEDVKSQNLWGMTFTGGTSNYGVLFEYNEGTSTYTDRVDFTGTSGSYPGSVFLEKLFFRCAHKFI